jgi:CRISPR-associated protein (TIGR03984 family)
MKEEALFNKIDFRLDVDLSTQNFEKDPCAWFAEQSSVGSPAWLLAFADDGVIWGFLDNGEFHLSGNTYPQVSPQLDTNTLQQAFLFGEKAEVRVWRVENAFSASRMEDQPGEAQEAFDEDQVLWGTQIAPDTKKSDYFTLVTDGRQGLMHAIPLKLDTSSFKERGRQNRPLRLKLRHYLGTGEDGLVFIERSRLVSVFVCEGQVE